MSSIKRCWINIVSENVASISFEAIENRIKCEQLPVREGDSDDVRYVTLLGNFSHLDLYRIKEEIQKYLNERDM